MVYYLDAYVRLMNDEDIKRNDDKSLAYVYHQVFNRFADLRLWCNNSTWGVPGYYYSKGERYCGGRWHPRRYLVNLSYAIYFYSDDVRIDFTIGQVLRLFDDSGVKIKPSMKPRSHNIMRLRTLKNTSSYRESDSRIQDAINTNKQLPWRHMGRVSRLALKDKYLCLQYDELRVHDRSSGWKNQHKRKQYM